MQFSRRTADRLVHMIAERSLAGARNQLRCDPSEMSAAEYRGYVRARAHHTVRLQARRLAAASGLPVDSFEPLVLPALERTTKLVIRQPAAQPTMPLPVAHVRLRFAG